MQQLKKNLETFGFSGADLEKILSAFSVRNYAKNAFFVEEGKTSQYLGFVERGMFQYYVLKDGEEITSYVSIENTYVSSLLSFISQTPAREYVRALSDAQLSVISRSALKTLAEEIPAFKDFYIKLLEGAICGIDSSRQDLIILSAEQRYEKMLRQEPHLLQQIPLQYLASILGVTPRHLSRIRNNIR
ncbi:MAG: Crp/Fnr family transcriptional regulator [Bacteroidota bacterium]